MKSLKKSEIIILLLALVSCFILVYATHQPIFELIEPSTFTYLEPQKYPYPFHADEYAHIASGISILDENKINYNPYLELPSDTREVGFSLILALIFATGINPVFLYTFLAPLMLAINALLLFKLMYNLTKKYWLSLCAIPFLAVIKSNTNFLGNWFFIPLTFSLSINLLFLIFFFKLLDDLEKNHKTGIKNPLFLVCLFLASLLIYPFASVVIAIVSATYLIFRKELLSKHLTKIIVVGSICGSLIICFIMLHFWTGNIQGTFSRFFTEIAFEKGTTSMEYEYSFLEIYGFIPLTLILIGLFSISTLKELNTNLKQLKIILIWPVLHLINWIIFTILKFSILITYQRNLFYLLVSLAPLAGLGLYIVIKRTAKVSADYKIAKTLTPILITLLILIACFKSYYNIEPKRFSLQKIMTEEEYNSLKWIEKEHGKYNKILANPFLSQAVYPVANQRVVAFISSNLEGGDHSKYNKFIEMNCAQKEDFAQQEKVDFIIARTRMQCNQFIEIFTDKTIGVYTLNNRETI